MKSQTLIGTLLVCALALTACGTPATPTKPPTQPPVNTPVPASTDTAVPASTDTPEPPPPATPIELVPTQSSSPEVTVMLRTKDGISSPYLVDGQGFSLYLFTKDTQNSGASTCTGTCAQNWPPLIVTKTPVAGEGVDANLLGTIKLADGTLQATYNGWPLYYFAQDTAAGATEGQGVNSVWYLVSATGEAIMQ